MRQNRIMIVLLQFSMALYVVIDLLNSSIIGNSSSNRTMVYIMLGFMIIVTLIFHIVSKGFRISYISGAFLLIFLWILVDNTLINYLSWQGIVHIGLSLFWILLFGFYRKNITEDPESIILIERFLRILVYFYIIATIYAVFAVRAISVRSTSQVLSTSYYMLAFLPIVLSSQNKKYKNITMIIIIVSVFITFKRGAIIALFAMIAVYSYSKKKIDRQKGRLLRIILIIFALLILLVLFDSLFGGEILSRFSPESLSDGSGRSHIYQKAIYVFNNSSFFHQLFGYGGSGTLMLLGIAAHNEWLEFLIDYGIVGVILYCIMILSLLTHYFRRLKAHDTNSPYIGMITIFFALVGIYGAIYFMQSTIFLFSMLGLFYSNNVLHELNER